MAGLDAIKPSGPAYRLGSFLPFLDKLLGASRADGPLGAFAAVLAGTDPPGADPGLDRSALLRRPNLVGRPGAARAAPGPRRRGVRLEFFAMVETAGVAVAERAGGAP